MPKAYLIAHIRVQEAEEFERFKELSHHAISKHGCRVLVRNPNPDIREGNVTGMVVLLEFDDIKAARSFYESDSYRAARAVREVSAETDLLLVEGL